MSNLTKKEQFEEDIIPHTDAMYHFAIQLTSDPNDAEDLVQNAFVKAYRFFDSYELGTNAKAWLFRILKNSYINEYRKKSKQPSQVDFDDVSSFYESIRDERTDTSNMEEQMYRDLLDDDISKALKDIPEDFRTVIFLCDVEDFTYEEISNMLDIPIGTVRSRLHRGRNLLMDYLASYGKKRGYGNEG